MGPTPCDQGFLDSDLVRALPKASDHRLNNSRRHPCSKHSRSAPVLVSGPNRLTPAALLASRRARRKTLPGGLPGSPVKGGGTQPRGWVERPQSSVPGGGAVGAGGRSLLSVTQLKEVIDSQAASDRLAPAIRARLVRYLSLSLSIYLWVPWGVGNCAN